MSAQQKAQEMAPVQSAQQPLATPQLAPQTPPAAPQKLGLMERMSVALDQPVTYKSALKGVGYVALGVAAYEGVRFVAHKASGGTVSLPGIIKYKAVGASEGTVIPIKAAR